MPRRADRPLSWRSDAAERGISEAHAESLPGVQSGATDALCDDPGAFVTALAAAHDWCNQSIEPDSLVRDYHLHRLLRHLYREVGADGEVTDTPPKGPVRKVGHLAFGGGTSLVSARRLTERDSEDVDLLFVADEGVSKGQFRRIRRDVLRTAAAGVAPDVPFSEHLRSSTGYIGRAYFTVGAAAVRQGRRARPVARRQRHGCLRRRKGEQPQPG